MSKLNNKLSAVVVARNEEEKILDCLTSLKFADETVVVANDSTDATLKISKSAGAKIYLLEGGDFSSRKNFAFSKTVGKWIFSLDADERASNELKQEILEILKNNTVNYSAYAIPRINVIMGKEFKHSGQYPDYVVRLFNKNKFVRWEGKLHEQPKIVGKLGYLKTHIIHIKHDNLSDMVEKTNKWSLVEAKLMMEAGHPKMNIVRFLSAILREFYLRGIKQKSYLDGTEGVLYALYQVFSKFLSYAKLWELQQTL
jgi:glycosyltransferase involved in cell wall biosynthesis